MKNLTEAREAIIADIIAERDRQDQKWGRQAGFWDDHDMVKLTVATEELGEIAQAILKHDDDNLHEEIIQTMAVLMAWAETIEMNPTTEEVIMEGQTTLDEEIYYLSSEIGDLQKILVNKIAEKRSTCSHIFKESHHWNHDNGWDLHYKSGTDYVCELCGIYLKEERYTGSSRDIEITLSDKTLLKIKDNKLMIFDPVLREFKRRSEYGNKKVEDFLFSGMKILLEEFGVLNSEERIENEK